MVSHCHLSLHQVCPPWQQEKKGGGGFSVGILRFYSNNTGVLFLHLIDKRGGRYGKNVKLTLKEIKRYRSKNAKEKKK